MSVLIEKLYKNNYLLHHDEIGKSKFIGYKIPSETVFGKRKLRENVG